MEKNIISGSLFAPISSDDSTWCIVERNGEKRVQVTLSKRKETNTRDHWLYVVEGEAMVSSNSTDFGKNINLIDPDDPDSMRNAIKSIKENKKNN